jgi:hypothetical protein
LIQADIDNEELIITVADKRTTEVADVRVDLSDFLQVARELQQDNL